MFKLQDYNKATWSQNFVASVAGSSASLIVSAPLDVIKTRIQNRNFENPESGFRILTKMARNEGFSSFFKGLVPKVCCALKWPSRRYGHLTLTLMPSPQLLMTGPKLTFSFWLAQTLIPAFDDMFAGR